MMPKTSLAWYFDPRCQDYIVMNFVLLPQNNKNFLFQLVNQYKSSRYSILFYIPAHSTQFHPFRSVQLNFTQYGDFGRYVNESLFFFSKPFFFITSLTYNILLLFFFSNVFSFFFLLYSHTTCFSFFINIYFLFTYI